MKDKQIEKNEDIKTTNHEVVRKNNNEKRKMF